MPGNPPGDESADGAAGRGAWPVFLAFLRLGLTSFGGPVAHLGYFRDEFVSRRRWLDERAYADLVALCQFLPGPASSQVGMVIGLLRAGHAGALAAWAGFTLPSALLLILFAIGLASHGASLPAGALHGLKVVAVAVVAQAVWGMARSLCPDAPRIALMAAACVATLLLPSAWAQVGIIAAAGVSGLRLCAPAASASPLAVPVAGSRRAGLGWLLLFAGLLAVLPLLAALLPQTVLPRVDAFYRAGALVFGGGHVVLPLLQAEVVPAGWVDPQTFLAGYGAAQAVPGPLFTFAAFLGATASGGTASWSGGLLCLLAIFAPAYFLVAGALPFWARLRASPPMQAALAGINAAVVGLLLAALYHPVWTGAIHRPVDFALALLAFVALVSWKQPPWRVVAGCALVGGLLPAL